MTINLTHEEWQEKAQKNKIKRINWAIENIGKMAEILPLYSNADKELDVRKLKCSLIDSWDEWSDDIIRIFFTPYISDMLNCDIKIHEEDLDKFIAKYLEWKGKKIVEIEK